MSARVAPHTLSALGLATAAILLAGCGSSKPAYCSRVNDLKSSIKQIENVSPLSTGSNSIVSTVDKIEGSANAVVSSAKSDFPSQTSTISSSYSALKATVTQISNGQTNTATLTGLPGEINAFATAIDDFESASKAKCS